MVDDPLLGDASVAVADSVVHAVQALAHAGHRIGRVPTPMALHALIAAHRTVLEYELSRLHAQFAIDHAAELSPAWLAAIQRGLRISDAEHLAARQTLQQGQNDNWAR